ncbi:MAG: hypothetical protein ACTS3F_11580 [Phycisphaerales bacterium]
MSNPKTRTTAIAASITALTLITAANAGTGSGPGGPDVTLCQLYGLQQYGSSGDIRGLALATTSWNVGDQDFAWFQSPNWQHPHIVMNMYRIDPNGRMIQLGQSWIKHGFFALSNTQCGGSCTFEPGHSGGDWLGINCTDTYGSSLNASQSGLGPRFEVNPWDGTWQYNGSMFQQGGPSNTPIRRRLQVKDSELNPANHPGSEYLYEGYYVHFDDVDVMNSVAYQFCTPIRSAQGNYSFSQPSAYNFPNIGFAPLAWDVTQREIIAEELPVVEFESPDGRGMLMTNVIDEGKGQYRYEYAILNIDNDRQFGSFTVPVPAGVEVTDIGFYAVAHHDEPYNARPSQGGIAINNNPWTVTEGADSITWSTDANPLRWGTMYNFWFTANSAPVDATADVGLFRAVADKGRPDVIPGPIQGPGPIEVPCTGDLNGDLSVDSKDLGILLGAFGSTDAGDLDDDGDTDSDDLGILLGLFATNC